MMVCIRGLSVSSIYSYIFFVKNELQCKQHTPLVTSLAHYVGSPEYRGSMKDLIYRNVKSRVLKIAYFTAHIGFY
jgi:hypothetical protein